MPVVTARAQRKAVPVTIPAVGTVEAVSSVQIRSQVTGQLTAIHFAEGREVRQGAAAVQPRSAAVPGGAAAGAGGPGARHGDAAERAGASRRELDTLFQRGLIAREQYESQRASTAALAATVEADKAAIETARLNLQYTEITAPITGRTGSLGAHVGDLVRANDTTPLVVINQLAPVYVTFSVPGRFLRGHPALPGAEAALGDCSGATGFESGGRPGANAGGRRRGRAGNGGDAASTGAARGVLTFIDNAVDATTGTIRLKGTFPNGDHQLWPGAFVQVTLDLTTEPDAIVVPATAVQTSQDGPVRLRRQAGSHGRDAAGQGRAAAGRRGGDCRGRRRRRGGRDRRAAAADAGRARLGARASAGRPERGARLVAAAGSPRTRP